MIESIATLQRLSQRRRFSQIAGCFFNWEAGKANEVARLSHERPDRLAAFDKQTGHVAPDESRSARDENHFTCEPLTFGS